MFDAKTLYIWKENAGFVITVVNLLVTGYTDYIFHCITTKDAKNGSITSYHLTTNQTLIYIPMWTTRVIKMTCSITTVIFFPDGQETNEGL